MFCNGCAAENAADAVFCSKCGREIGRAPEATPPVAQARPSATGAPVLKKQPVQWGWAILGIAVTGCVLWLSFSTPSSSSGRSSSTEAADKAAFDRMLDATGASKSRLVTATRVNSHKVTIVVTAAWFNSPKGVRLAAAEDFLQTWTAVTAPESRGDARIVIEDGHGNELATSGIMDHTVKLSDLN